MPSNSRDWLRSITIASPVLLAAVVSLVLVATSIINPVEAVNPGAGPGDGDGQGQGNGGGQSGDVLSITAQELYGNYIEFANEVDSVSFHPYTGRLLSVSGVLASWNNTGEPYITLGTDFGGENVKFIFNFYFTDLEVMDELINSRITVFGVSSGMIDGVVILIDAYSTDFDINDAATVG